MIVPDDALTVSRPDPVAVHGAALVAAMDAHYRAGLAALFPGVVLAETVGEARARGVSEAEIEARWNAGPGRILAALDDDDPDNP